VGALVDDGDRHIPPVLDSFGFARLEDFLHVGQGQTRLCSHGHSLGNWLEFLPADGLTVDGLRGLERDK
jgi:hypothetical protein